MGRVPSLTDIFAGAGGSSTGADLVPGVHVQLSANHWPLAVRVHAANFPDTIHACVDLHMEDPRNFPKTDMLWASPECTKWSIANSKAKELSVQMGGDPTLFDDVPDDLISEGEYEITRSRLLMFDVLRFIEHHRYRSVVVENVIDIATQPKYRAAWTAWRKGLRKLGYLFRIVSLNSMHAQMMGLPAPQSRDRLYIIAWPEGEAEPDIERVLRPQAWCYRCERLVESRQAWKPGRSVGRYRAQYVYACPDCGTAVEPGWLPASTAIDWSIQGQLIGERDKPLSPKTMARIREGLRRYGHEFILEAGGNQTTRNELGILTMLRGTNAPKLTSEAMDTLAASGLHHGLLVPSGGTWHEDAYPTGAPMRTVTTRENHGLLVPYYSASETAKPTSDPIGTLTTVDRYALLDYGPVTRADVFAGRWERTEPKPERREYRSWSDDAPTPTIDPDDCTFRMLEPHEIAAGMAFPADYRWEGTKRERVRLAGNAVTPPAARDIVSVLAEGLDAA